MFFLNVSHGMGIIIIMTWSRAWSWAWTWKYRTWKFCTWKCHTVHIDVHVYFFAVNLVLVGLSEIFSSVFEAIKKLPVSNCSKTYAELYLKELARALFADTYILPALNNRAIEQIPWKASFIIEIVTNFPKFTLFLSLGLWKI